MKSRSLRRTSDDVRCLEEDFDGEAAAAAAAAAVGNTATAPGGMFGHDIQLPHGSFLCPLGHLFRVWRFGDCTILTQRFVSLSKYSSLLHFGARVLYSGPKDCNFVFFLVACLCIMDVLFFFDFRMKKKNNKGLYITLQVAVNEKKMPPRSCVH